MTSVPSETAPGTKLKFSVERILASEPSAPAREPSPRVSEPSCLECVAALYRCCRDETSLLPMSLPLPYTHLHPALRPTTANVYRLPVSSSSPSQPNSRCDVTSTGKRKRSWSRAVFSNLQRKGLERRFQIQKYITKPDRRQLAATLGLTDAQGTQDRAPYWLILRLLFKLIHICTDTGGSHWTVRLQVVLVKVWFQNRRMKWRHTKEGRGGAAPPRDPDSTAFEDNEDVDVDTLSD